MNTYDQLIESLREDGLKTASNKLHLLLHERAWTNQREFLFHFGHEMKTSHEKYDLKMSALSKQLFGDIAQQIRPIHPEIDL